VQTLIDLYKFRFVLTSLVSKNLKVWTRRLRVVEKLVPDSIA
jgi:hypothetical protein